MSSPRFRWELFGLDFVWGKFSTCLRKIQSRATLLKQSSGRLVPPETQDCMARRFLSLIAKIRPMMTPVGLSNDDWDKLLLYVQNCQVGPVIGPEPRMLSSNGSREPD